MVKAFTRGAKAVGTVVVRCRRMRGKVEGVVIDTRLKSRERVENLIMGSTMISPIHPFNLKKSTLLSSRGANVGLGGATLDI